MVADLICFVISLCCGRPRQGHERRHIHDIIDDIEQLAEEEFETVSYTHLTLPTIYSV